MVRCRWLSSSSAAAPGRCFSDQRVCVPGRLPVNGGQPSELLAASQG